MNSKDDIPVTNRNKTQDIFVYARVAGQTTTPG